MDWHSGYISLPIIHQRSKVLRKRKEIQLETLLPTLALSIGNWKVKNGSSILFQKLSNRHIFFKLFILHVVSLWFPTSNSCLCI